MFAIWAPTAANAATVLSGGPCAAAKLRAAGIEALDRTRCEKRGLASSPAPACVSAASARRDAAFERAEVVTPCLATNDSDDIGGEVDALVATALAEVRPGGPESSRCAGAQLVAMGRAFRDLTRAYARYRRSVDPALLAQNIAAAQSAFASSYALAESKGDCIGGASAAEAFATVTDGVSRLRGMLTPSCGDGVLGPGEACDRGETESCGGACRINCTCATSP